jgi:hypothetical protein
MSVVLPCGRAGFASRRLSRVAGEHSVERPGVDDPGDAQCAPEGATALRKCEAGRIGMQMRSPSRPDACRVGLDGDQFVTGLIDTTRDRDDSQQLGGFGPSPTTHTGAYRRRAAYHVESLP